MKKVVEYISDEMVELNKRFDQKLQIGEIISVSHTDSYPYERLPENATFRHIGNLGNPYTGLVSILEVVEE